MKLTPIQPLCLVINSYLKRPMSAVTHAGKPSLPKITSTTSTTTFASINVTINHDWTNVNITSDKSDKAPVPSVLWDERLKASFPHHPDIMTLVMGLRTLCLCKFRRNLTSSFITYLRMTFSTDWANFLSGDRSSKRGEVFLSDFHNSIQWGRDVIKKATGASWFEWKTGSTLVFWRWPRYLKEARDGFYMYINVDKRLGRLNSRKVCKSDLPISNELKALQVEKLSRII